MDASGSQRGAPSRQHVKFKPDNGTLKSLTKISFVETLFWLSCIFIQSPGIQYYICEKCLAYMAAQKGASNMKLYTLYGITKNSNPRYSPTERLITPRHANTWIMHRIFTLNEKVSDEKSTPLDKYTVAIHIYGKCMFTCKIDCINVNRFTMMKHSNKKYHWALHSPTNMPYRNTTCIKAGWSIKTLESERFIREYIMHLWKLRKFIFRFHLWRFYESSEKLWILHVQVWPLSLTKYSHIPVYIS